MRRLVLVSALTLAACASESPSSGLGEGADGGPRPDSGAALDAGASPDAGPMRCEDLDEAACALTNCRSKTCYGCEGEPLLSLCFGEVEPSCPDILCPPPCHVLGEAECVDAGDRCRVDRCPACRQPDQFVTCSEAEAPPLACPPVACPPCEVLSELECAEDPGCHRVFDGGDPDGCLCNSPGCCHRFTRCAEGGRADCTGDDLACRSPAPWCEGPYVISYEGYCYEGCVLAGDCGP